MLVAFWGIEEGQVATTSNTLAVANLMALEYKEQLLISHTSAKNTSIESAYTSIRSESNLRGGQFKGMIEIETYADSARLSPDHVYKSAEKIYQDKLYMLHGAGELSPESVLNILPKLFDVMGDKFKLSFFDVDSSKENGITDLVLSKADLIVINLSQNINITDKFFKNGLPEFFKDKQIMFCVGAYDTRCKMTVSKIASRYGIAKNRIGFIPYNSGYRDSLNYFNVPDFFLRVTMAKASLFEFNEDAHFANSARAVCRMIIKILSLNLEREERL